MRPRASAAARRRCAARSRRASRSPPPPPPSEPWTRTGEPDKAIRDVYLRGLREWGENGPRLIPCVEPLSAPPPGEPGACPAQAQAQAPTILWGPAAAADSVIVASVDGVGCKTAEVDAATLGQV